MWKLIKDLLKHCWGLMLGTLLRWILEPPFGTYIHLTSHEWRFVHMRGDLFLDDVPQLSALEAWWLVSSGSVRRQLVLRYDALLLQKKSTLLADIDALIFLGSLSLLSQFSLASRNALGQKSCANGWTQ